MTSREYQEALVAELGRHGVTDYRVEQGRKHFKLTFKRDGKRKTVTFPSTPSDARRGLKNSLTDLRHALGVKKAVVKRVSTKPKRVKVGKPAQKPELLKVAEARPFAALETLQEPVNAPQFGMGADIAEVEWPQRGVVGTPYEPASPITIGGVLFTKDTFKDWPPADPDSYNAASEPPPRPWWRRALDRLASFFVARKTGGLCQ